MDYSKQIQQSLEKLQSDFNLENFDNLKKSIYFFQLYRLLNNLNLLFKAETKLLDLIDDLDAKDLITLQKSTVKSIDNISSSLRQFEPSLKENVNIEKVLEDLDINLEDDITVVFQKVMKQQVIALLKSVYEIKENMDKFKIGSIDHWKHSEALKGLSSLLLDIAKTVQKLKEEGIVDEEISIKELMEVYEKFTK